MRLADEFKAIDLGDPRLNRRAALLAEQLGQRHFITHNSPMRSNRRFPMTRQAFHELGTKRIQDLGVGRPAP